MGKVVLWILIAAILFAGYWFWYYQEGANRPITIEADVRAQFAGLPLPVPGATGKVELNLTTKKIRLHVRSNTGEQVAILLRMDKRKLYLINYKKKSYAAVEFNLVSASNTDPYLADMSLKKDFVIQNEAKVFGKDGERYFARLYKLQSETGPAMRMQCWFTKDTRIGRGYVNLINSILRIDPTNLGAVAGDVGIFKKGKRSHIRFLHLDYFPIPLKVSMSGSGPQGSMAVDWTVTKLSRESIPSRTFDVPSGFKETSLQQMKQ